VTRPATPSGGVRTWRAWRRPGPRPRRRLALALVLALALAAGAVVAASGASRGRASASESGAVVPADTYGTFAVRGWVATGHVLQVGARMRSYLVARPADRPVARRGAPALPVLVLLHGRGMTAATMARRTGMLGSTPAIVVLPVGYGRSWNAGGCCAAARAAHVDDVTFLTRVVERVIEDSPDADHGAVYLVGFSNGGRMAYRVACHAPGLFTAVAAVEAVSVDTCRRLAAPVPLLVVASTADPLLRITPAAPQRWMEGYRQPSVTGVVQAWRALDGCSGAPTVTTAGTLTRSRWTGCGGAEIGLDLYAGGGHQWPAGTAPQAGSRAASSQDSLTPSAQAELWAFFRTTAKPPAPTR
jgi:polyhydroxybutyrate depolymerase